MKPFVFRPSLPIIFSLLALITLGLAPGAAFADETIPTWGEEPQQETTPEPAPQSSETQSSDGVTYSYDQNDREASMAPVVLVQSLTTAVGTGLWIVGGFVLLFTGAFGGDEPLALIGVGMLAATPLTAAALANTTAVLMNQNSHFLWTLAGSIAGGLGALLVGNVVAEFFPGPLAAAAALTTITAGTVGGYQIGRNRNIRAQRSLTLQPVHTPSLDASTLTPATEVSGAPLNWSFRF